MMRLSVCLCGALTIRRGATLLFLVTQQYEIVSRHVEGTVSRHVLVGGLGDS